MKPIYLKTIRLRKELTQAQLSDRSGVPQGVISKLETGVALNAEFDTRVKLADALDVDIRALRFGPDPRAERKAS